MDTYIVVLSFFLAGYGAHVQVGSSLIEGQTHSLTEQQWANVSEQLLPLQKIAYDSIVDETRYFMVDGDSENERACVAIAVKVGILEERRSVKFDGLRNLAVTRCVDVHDRSCSLFLHFRFSRRVSTLIARLTTLDERGADDGI
jgi:hypothetical protein